MTSMRRFINLVAESMSFSIQPQGGRNAGAEAVASLKWHKEKDMRTGMVIWNADIGLPSKRTFNIKFSNAVSANGSIIAVVAETTALQVRKSLKQDEQGKQQDNKALYPQIVQAIRFYLENQKPRTLTMNSDEPEMKKRLGQIIPHFASFFGKLGYAANGTTLTQILADN